MQAGPIHSCECRMQHNSEEKKKLATNSRPPFVCTHTQSLSHSLSLPIEGALNIVHFFLVTHLTYRTQDEIRLVYIYVSASQDCKARLRQAARRSRTILSVTLAYIHIYILHM